MSEEIIDLLQGVVEKAWKEEKAFGKLVFGKAPRKNHSLCQGISRNVFHKVFGCFPNTTMLKFEVEGKSHIVVYVSHKLQSYVIDGTLKQFRPDNGMMVFLKEAYPFWRELQTGERWHT